MNKLTKLLSIGALLALSTPAAAQISFDIHIGPPPRPRREVVVEAPYPEAVWVAGYQRYDDHERNYVWVPGAWQRPPQAHATWVKPRYVRNGNHYDYYEGKWGNPGKHKGWAKQEDKGGNGHKEGNGNKGRD